MIAYVFRATESKSGDWAACSLEALSDDEACEIANGLLSNVEFSMVEVWNRNRLIYRIARQDPGIT